jgi:hypothetical protein
VKEERTFKQKPSQAKSQTPARKSKPPPEPEFVRDMAIRPPRLTPGGVCTADDLVVNLGIGRNTLNKWKRNRQKPLKPLDLGTREEYYSTTVVIEFLCTYRHSVDG